MEQTPLSQIFWNGIVSRISLKVWLKCFEFQPWCKLCWFGVSRQMIQQCIHLDINQTLNTFTVVVLYCFIILEWVCLPICRSPLQWCHNEHESISNHQPHDYILKCLFRRRKKNIKAPCHWPLCVGNSSVTGEFPTQRASNAENLMTSSCLHFSVHSWALIVSISTQRGWYKMANILPMRISNEFSVSNIIFWV